MPDKNKANDKAGFDFDKAFLRYAVAGSAILGLPLLASAQATSTPQTITTTSGPTSLPVTFDGVATDFTLNVGFYDDVSSGVEYPKVWVSGQSTTSFLGAFEFPGKFSAPYPTAFASAGGVIGGASGSTVTGGNLLKSTSNTLGYKGNWTNNLSDASWLGVFFQSNGAEYLGWAEIAAYVTPDPSECSESCSVADNVATATLEGTGFSTVPETGSIMLLALGAAGLALLRKRRGGLN